MTLTFPRIATQTNQWWLTVLIGLLAVVLYGIAGEIALNLKPTVLPLTALDQSVPFLPWTFWIYSSVYLIYFASSALQRDLDAFNKFLYGYVFAYGASAVFFVLVPTVFPREAFSLPTESATFSEATLRWFRGIDHPTNCFPSMHVASAVMSTMVFYRRRPVVFALFCVWAAFISLTTLTTKQHFFVDVVAGTAFGLFSHFLVFYWFRYRTPVPGETRVGRSSWQDISSSR